MRNAGAKVTRTLDDERLLADCRVETFRGSGPGGQKRNKTSSGVRIVHLDSGLSAMATESRSQAQNKTRALRRLRHRMALELREPVALAKFSRPHWLPVNGGHIEVGPRHEAYFAALGLVLDVLSAANWSVSRAAGAMGLSTSALVAFLQGDSKLLAKVNQMRSAQKLKPLGAR